MFGTVTGIMMALFLDNVGGAWDNAKKYVEVRGVGLNDPSGISDLVDPSWLVGVISLRVLL